MNIIAMTPKEITTVLRQCFSITDEQGNVMFPYMVEYHGDTFNQRSEDDQIEIIQSIPELLPYIEEPSEKIIALAKMTTVLNK